jgi:hypothetical protein
MKIVFHSFEKAADWIKQNVSGELEQEKVFIKIVRQYKMSGQIFLHITPTL